MKRQRPREMSLLQCHTSHHPFPPAHAGSRALRLHHQTSLVPACTTEQPLTPSLPENQLILPKKNRIGNATSSPSPGRFGWGWLRSGAVGFPLQTQRDAGFFAEGRGDLEACPFKCCWRLFLGHWLKIKIRIPLFFIRKSSIRFTHSATLHIPTAP